jgi:hypothetical protein
VFILVPLVNELKLAIMGVGGRKRVCVYQEILREPMGLENGKWGLCIHKGVAP